MDQLSNPESISFTPAGMWKNESILSGRIATAYETSVSQDLIKRFNSAIKKRFTKIEVFWVGPEALVHPYEGKRLAAAAQSPPDFDLRIRSKS